MSCLFPPFSTLDEVKLKEKGRAFHDLFLTKVSVNPTTPLFTVVLYFLIQSNLQFYWKSALEDCMCGLEVFLCKCVKTIPVKFGYLLIALRLYGIPSSSFVTQKCSNIEYNGQPCTKLFDMMSSSVLSLLLVDFDKVVLSFSVVTTAERDCCCTTR